MTSLTVSSELPPASPDDLAKTLALRDRIAELPPVEIPTEHFLHGGLYVRTCLVPANAVIAGAIIKVPTVVTVSGKCCLTVGNVVRMIDGYAVLRGLPGRSQVFRAYEDTYITMSFVTKAKTVEEAEEEFTDEFESLLSRRK